MLIDRDASLSAAPHDDLSGEVPERRAWARVLRGVAYGLLGVVGLVGVFILALVLLVWRPPPPRLVETPRPAAVAVAPVDAETSPVALARDGDAPDSQLRAIRTQVQSEIAVLSALRDQADAAQQELAQLRSQQEQARIALAELQRQQQDGRAGPVPAAPPRTNPGQAAQSQAGPVPAASAPPAPPQAVPAIVVQPRMVPTPLVPALPAATPAPPPVAAAPAVAPPAPTGPSPPLQAAAAPAGQPVPDRPASGPAPERLAGQPATDQPRPASTPSLDRVLERLRQPEAAQTEQSPPQRSPPPALLGQISSATTDPGAEPARAPVRPRVFMHYRSGSGRGQDAAADLARRLLFSDFAYAETRIVPASTTVPVIRYFHREDADAAQRLADLLRSSGMDFRVQDGSGMQALAPAGTIEVWIPS